MTATQSLKIYEILQRHFKNDADAKVVVEEIEYIIDNKFDAKKDVLSTKEDILKLQLEIEKRLNTFMIWIMGTIIAVGALIVALIKL